VRLQQSLATSPWAFSSCGSEWGEAEPTITCSRGFQSNSQIINVFSFPWCDVTSVADTFSLSPRTDFYSPMAAAGKTPSADLQVQGPGARSSPAWSQPNLGMNPPGDAAACVGAEAGSSSVPLQVPRRGAAPLLPPSRRWGRGLKPIMGEASVNVASLEEDRAPIR